METRSTLAAIPIAVALAACTLLVDTTGFDDARAVTPPDASSPSDGGEDTSTPTDAALRDRTLPDGGIMWSGNGHAYVVVNKGAPIAWVLAKSEAENMGGHLATIGSAEEDQFVFTLVQAADVNGVAYLGGSQSAGAAEPAGGWSWITGEPFTYQAWTLGEPNNTGPSGEAYLGYKGKVLPAWNDTGPNSSNAYVLEIE